MDVLNHILESITNAGKGHWIYAHTAATNWVEEAISQKLRTGGRILFLHLNILDGQFYDEPPNFIKSPISSLIPRLSDLLDEAKKEGVGIARCLITGLERMPVADQCNILEQTRNLRESTHLAALQIIISGPWNHLRAREYWKQAKLHASPVPERHHVTYSSGTSREYILIRLQAAGLIAQKPAELDCLCADVLHESTGGDRFFINHIISTLHQQQRSIDYLENAIEHAAESDAVISNLTARTVGFTKSGWHLLKCLLEQIYVEIAESNPDAEDLLLAGIITVRLNGGKRTLTIASNLVQKVLRAQWQQLEPQKTFVYLGADLSNPTMAINTAAFLLVAKIENLLRNLCVLTLSSSTAHWTESIEPIKTGAFVASDSTDEAIQLIRKVLQVVESTAPSSSPAPPDGTMTNQTELSSTDGSVSTSSVKAYPKKGAQISIVASAQDWLMRQNKCSILELSNPTLIYFLTTEDLTKVFLNKNLYQSHWQRFFPNKGELVIFLEHYVSVRAAVAHHQPINLTTLRRLQDQFVILQRRICMGQPTQV